ncbi:MAG: hypothetical protein ACO20H_09085 [Bacteriovoracaceae bacterium]
MKYILLFLIPCSLFADPFQIINRNLGSNPALESQINSLFDQIENDVNSQLPDADQSTYLKGMANASVMGLKGTGSDYNNEIIFTGLRFSVGLGVDLGAVGLSELVGGDVDLQNVRGVNIQQTFNLGVDLSAFNAGKIGVIDFSKMELFLNYGSVNPRNYSSSVNGSVKNLGIHGRYQLIEKSEILPLGLLSFGGLFFHFGYEQSLTNLSVTINTDYSRAEAGVGTLTASGTATVGAKVATYSFPFEISTYFDWLTFMTTHFGLGLDFNFGKATSIAELNSNISYDNDGTVSGDGVLDIGQQAKPTKAFVRWFLGHQFHLSLLKVNIGLGHVPNTGLWNLNAGVMLTY